MFSVVALLPTPDEEGIETLQLFRPYSGDSPCLLPTPDEEGIETLDKTPEENTGAKPLALLPTPDEEGIETIKCASTSFRL